MSQTSPRKVRLSIGSWAYCFGPYQNQPVPLPTVVETLARLGYDGLELGAFKPHPGPGDTDTKAKRGELRRLVRGHGLEFSGIAIDLWTVPFMTGPDSYAWWRTLETNLEFAFDLGIDTVRIDTVSPPSVLGPVEGLKAETVVDYNLAYDRTVRCFKAAAKRAAEYGQRIIWEFEPGFAFNKPREIVRLAHDVGEPNFGVLYDTCHAHMVAAVGALQPGQRETLPGGALELLGQLTGKVGHIHLIDSDGSLNEHNTSTHNPFGTGHLNFETLVPALLASGCPSDWWCVDLCFWPDAWNVTEHSKRFLEPLIAKYAA